MAKKLIEHYEIKGENTIKTIDESHSQDSLAAKDDGIIHDTYKFENTMISYIRDGEVEKLRKLFEKLAENTDFSIGILADDPLRQAKNLLIGLTAVVGKVAGIPGGMPIEEAYRLIDIYTQGCEKCSSIEEVRILQYNMIMDFAKRVRQYKLPEGLSQETFEIIQFITNNSNQDISLDDIARHVGISRSFMTRKFRQETGKSITDYLTEIRIRDAKRFLRYTTRSLTDIANILGFASQSYFQTVFKKHVGITPKEYRTTTSKL